jgi:hypothetical protein
MPRPPRLVAPGGTVYVVARCKSRGFCFTSPDDFAVLDPSDDFRAEARDARWATQRAVGSPGFLGEHLPRRSRRTLVSLSPTILALAD